MSIVGAFDLAEAFGLTVSEGIWKGRPVIGSAVGGITDQVADGTGILLPDPDDLAAFGTAARLLLGDPDQAARMGRAAMPTSASSTSGMCTCCATPGCLAR